MNKYVLVDKELHEIFCTEYGGYLPPMTKHEIIKLFNNLSMKEIENKYNVAFYKTNEEYHCPHCGTPVVKSDVLGYSWQCFYCDEDFYHFEVIEQPEIYLKELVNDLLSRLEEFESATDTIKYLLNIGYDRKQILKMGFFEEDYNWASKELQDEICGGGII